MDRERELPAAGQRYRHFKGNLYQIVGVARDSEDVDNLVVVYQALYGDYGLYVRPLDMFMSEVDHDKYPNATAKYRFERVDGTANSGENERANSGEKNLAPVAKEDEKEEQSINNTENVIMHEIKKDVTSEVFTSPEWEVQENYEGEVRPELIRFLDAETSKERLEVLRQIKSKMDEQLLTNLELSLDLMPDERETMERRIDLIERNLENRMRFETSRLR